MVSQVIAFDSDGVICDGLAEYFHSAAIAYQQITQTNLEQKTLESLRPAFYELRPVIETGWEMVVLIHVLLQGQNSNVIWQDWRRILAQSLSHWDTTQDGLMLALDTVRDRQITNELDHWLSLHRFYDGMPACLKQLLADDAVETYIITTKEARFVHQLLQQQNINFPSSNIFGKETKQPKSEILKQLLQKHKSTFWFIEDRLKTLGKVQKEPELTAVKLFLATWGYNCFMVGERLPLRGIEAVDLGGWLEKVAQLSP
ncbi:HAD family hydrolase [[Limnothrix rosea] IAM M-220]|uniref:HAD family hydrolase n=1 Tax=[Limnothrix rosea] IAM M-220 TaxID=454133 RepID=UPI00096209F7|nr:HAD family hydrolase [[Limnothrix rosea] IAM M-220]OKH19179.1 hypothetical protein NIES208_02710 [[Limnothrix rosea] IAM M-220]